MHNVRCLQVQDTSLQDICDWIIQNVYKTEIECCMEEGGKPEMSILGVYLYYLWVFFVQTLSYSYNIQEQLIYQEQIQAEQHLPC